MASLLSSCPSTPRRCSASQPQPARQSHGQRCRTSSPALQRQRQRRLAAAAAWSGGGSGGGGGGGTPPLAALLAAVQVLAAVQLALPLPAAADNGDFTLSSRGGSEEEFEEQYFETVPQGLSSEDSSTAPRLGSLIEGPRGKAVQQCARKCVPTCIRGGQGAPGLGPMSLRGATGGVVFKEGYRSRTYCLSECTQVCALTVKQQADAAGK